MAPIIDELTRLQWACRLTLNELATLAAVSPSTLDRVLSRRELPTRTAARLRLARFVELNRNAKGRGELRLVAD